MLEWTWRKFSHSSKELPIDKNFAKPLCWFLLAENREQYIWEWMKVLAEEVRTSSDAKKPRRQRMGIEWEYHIPACLAEAHLAWAPGGIPNDALVCFETAVRLFATPGHKYYNTISSNVMEMVVLSYMAQRECPPADEALFDRLLSTLEVWQRHPRVSSHVARLKIYHPSRPDTDPFLRLLRAQNPYSNEGMFESVQHNGRDKLAFDFLRASYILRLQGSEQDALWLESVVEARNPRV